MICSLHIGKHNVNIVFDLFCSHLPARARTSGPGETEQEVEVRYKQGQMDKQK